MARIYVTDYPRETSKLVMQGNQMISTKLLIFDVTDKADKEIYTKLIESQAPQGKLWLSHVYVCSDSAEPADGGDHGRGRVSGADDQRAEEDCNNR